MRAVKGFSEHLSGGAARKVSPDRERAKNLALAARDKLSSLEEKVRKIGIRDDNANDYVENSYDAIMLLLRANLCLDGYSASGTGAHEAEVSYLMNLGLGEGEVRFADELRYIRNGILYYGRRLDREYAEKAVEFARATCRRLKSLLERRK